MMTLDEFQPLMEAFWDRLDQEADQSKDSQLALNQLQSTYASLDLGEQELAQQVLSAWVESGDSHRRFAALAMIDRLGLRSALPALRRLGEVYEHSEGPSAPYDWAKVNRIIGRLTET